MPRSIFLTLLLFACDTSKPSLILVTMDTTRADRIGAYGYENANTPNIDSFAEKGVVFDRAYSSVPLTTPSHATILTGLYPTKHGVHSNGDAILGDQVSTLAELLKSEGYSTYAAVSAFTTSSVWNLNQGFDVFLDDISATPGHKRWSRERPADSVVEASIDVLEKHKDGPYFLWVHFFDPHLPYDPPEPWASRIESSYDGEIAFMDEQIGKLATFVQSMNTDAKWILVGDHGESLNGEHNEFSHGLYLYEPTVHVPFIISPVEKPLNVDEPVGLVDVVPTALSLLGFEIPENLDGHNLSTLIGGGSLERGGIYMESDSVSRRFGYHPEVAMVDGKYKLMDTPNPRLFDLTKDSAEKENIYADNTGIVETIRPQIKTLRDQMEATESAPSSMAIDEQLAALGYVDSGNGVAQDLSIDAKDRADTILTLERIKGKKLTPKEQIVRYQKILEKEPQLIEAILGYGNSLAMTGEVEKAILVYEQALMAQPDSTVLKTNLAHMFAGKGELEKGLALLELILQQVPKDSEARVGILKMLTDLNRTEEALSRVEKWLEEEPNDQALQAHAGVILYKLERYPESQKLLEQSLSDNVPREHAFRTLADLSYKRGDREKALEYMGIELEHFPSVPKRLKYASLASAMEKWELALDQYKFIIEKQPDHVEARLGCAQMEFNLLKYSESEATLSPLLKVPNPIASVLLLQANIMGKLGNEKGGAQMFERAKAKRLEEIEALKKAQDSSDH